MNPLITIWIIDDTFEDLYIAMRILTKLNPDFRIVTFQNSEDAYRLLQEYYKQNKPLPESIILDLNMPVMNGFEFLESAMKVIPDLPQVFILTSSADESDKQKAKEFEPVKQFFTKPITIQMAEQIRSAVWAIKTMAFIALTTA